jgi:hypothetical protein
LAPAELLLAVVMLPTWPCKAPIPQSQAQESLLLPLAAGQAEQVLQPLVVVQLAAVLKVPTVDQVAVLVATILGMVLLFPAVLVQDQQPQIDKDLVAELVLVQAIAQQVAVAVQVPAAETEPLEPVVTAVPVFNTA